MAQPEGYVNPDRPNYVCKQNKNIYGLKQSARCWNSTLDQHLKSAGYRKSNADGCICIKLIMEEDEQTCFVILAVYVDDIITVSNDTLMLNAEKASLCHRFEMVDKGEAHHVLGMSIKRDRKAKTLFTSQPKYLEHVLQRFGMEDCKPVSTPIEPGEKFKKMSNNEETFDAQRYQQAMGCLTYA